MRRETRVEWEVEEDGGKVGGGAGGAMEQTRLGSRHGQRVWGKAMRVGQQTSDGRVAREGGMEDTGHRLPRVARPIVVAPAAIVAVPTVAIVVARATTVPVVPSPVPAHLQRENACAEPHKSFTAKFNLFISMLESMQIWN